MFFITRDAKKHGKNSDLENCLEPIKFVSSGIFSDFESNESVWITKSARDFVTPNDRQYIVLYSLLNFLDYDVFKYDVEK